MNCCSALRVKWDPQNRDEQGQSDVLGGLKEKKPHKSSQLIRKFFSTFPCLGLILCSSLAAPSPLLLLFKGLPVVTPQARSSRPKTRFTAALDFNPSAEPGPPARDAATGPCKIPAGEGGCAATAQALLSLKILDHSPLLELRKVHTSNQLKFWVVWVGFYFCRSTCFSQAQRWRGGSCHAGNLPKPSASLIHPPGVRSESPWVEQLLWRWPSS